MAWRSMKCRLILWMPFSTLIGRSIGIPTGAFLKPSPNNSQLKVPTLVQTRPNDTYGSNIGSHPIWPFHLLPWAYNSEANFSSLVNTLLYGYDECRSTMGPTAKGRIDDAYGAAWVLASRQGGYKSIDWSAPAALEYFGPPANTANFQDHIQSMFNNVADMIWTSSPWSSQSYIHVRCDDPQKQCQYLDSTCSEIGSSAYALQEDPDDGQPMINFCPSFFEKNNIIQGLGMGQTASYPFNSSPSAYDNTGRVLLHQLFHLDHLMGTDEATHVQDLAIDYQSGLGKRVKELANGASNVKILARLQYAASTPPFPPAGYYTSRNADSLAWFAMARWIQNQTGVYPHLPQVVPDSDRSPYPTSHPPMYLTFQNESDPKFTFADNMFNNANVSECFGDTDSWGGNDLLISINGMADDVMYPPEYLASKMKWLEVARSTPTPTPTSSLAPSSTLPSPTSALPTKTLPPGMPKDMCGVWYEDMADHFEIRGKDEFWDQQKLGAYGRGLLDNLRGCGAVSGWTWVRTPKDPNYDWFSRGYLPIGQKNCVGHAVVGAGGPDIDGCSGPG